MEQINFEALAIFTACAGIVAFWRGRGHSPWKIFSTVFFGLPLIFMGFFILVILFNVAFVKGDEFLEPPTWLFWAVPFVVWAVSVLALFAKNEDKADKHIG